MCKLVISHNIFQEKSLVQTHIWVLSNAKLNVFKDSQLINIHRRWVMFPSTYVPVNRIICIIPFSTFYKTIKLPRQWKPEVTWKGASIIFLFFLPFQAFIMIFLAYSTLYKIVYYKIIAIKSTNNYDKLCS